MLVRVSLLVILGGFPLAIAQADPYSFVGMNNNLGQPILFARYEYAIDACEAMVGNYYTVVPPVLIESAEYQYGSLNCLMRTDSNAVVIGTITVGNDSCPGDERFSFRAQICLDEVNEEQTHGLLLATFLWVCLMGGMLVGFRAAE